MRHCEESFVNNNTYFYTLHFKNDASVNNMIKVIVPKTKLIQGCRVEDFKLKSRLAELMTKFKVKVTLFNFKFKVVVMKTLNSRTDCLRKDKQLAFKLFSQLVPCEYKIYKESLNGLA